MSLVRFEQSTDGVQAFDIFSGRRLPDSDALIIQALLEIKSELSSVPQTRSEHNQPQAIEGAAAERLDSSSSQPSKNDLSPKG